jgi:endogenous inhibitor of DNA gyrase (YacG/DUF329 family)
VPAFDIDHAAAAVSRAASCPACGKTLDASCDARVRPFCSERCKMADLGGWFAERYSVPVKTSEDAEEAPEPDGETSPRQ